MQEYKGSLLLLLLESDSGINAGGTADGPELWCLFSLNGEKQGDVVILKQQGHYGTKLEVMHHAHLSAHTPPLHNAQSAAAVSASGNTAAARVPAAALQRSSVTAL